MAAAEEYGSKTVAELRELAREAGIPGAARLTKGKALNALLEKQRESQAIAHGNGNGKGPAKKAAPQKRATKAASVAAPASGTQSRSEAKAADFEAAAASLGWKTARRSDDDDRLTVVATRNGEQIAIEWMAGVFQPPCVYQMEGRTIQLRNASAAKQRMGMEPEKAAEEATRVVNRKYNAVERKAAPRRRQLNIDLEKMLDDEVLESLQGKRITWLNAISQSEESARVPHRSETRKPANKTRVHEGPRGREIWFVEPNGFKHVLLASIVAIR